MLAKSWFARVAALAAVILGLSVMAQAPAQASIAQDQMPSAVPSDNTPDVNNGTVFAIGKVGTRVFLGGDFTSATSRGSTGATSRQNILSFDPATGVIDSSFAPAMNGEVDAIIPGPDNTIYVAGQFKTVNGQNMRVARLDAASGATVPGWNPPYINANTTTMALSGGVLYVGGTFAKVSGQDQGGLVALDPASGSVLPWFDVNVSGHHGQGSARGGVGPKDIAIDPSGTTMIVIGNFTSVQDSQGTVDRDQVFKLTLGTSSATVDRNWRTLKYTGQCYNFAFDSYIRDVDWAPDGSYFIIGATGGGGLNPKNVDGSRSYCDAVARFDADSAGSSVSAKWVDFTGNDSIWSVAATGTAVYAGGHQRWANNPNGSDNPGPGAVPRPGLEALDPQNGLPLSWNPGRNPRGAGAFALLATDDGLYVGSDTKYIGNFRYQRERIAYFPLAGGSTLPANTEGTLPGTVYLAGSPANARPDVLYRVNAAGPLLGASDGGPDWAADDQAPSPYRNDTSNTSASNPSAFLDSTIPSGTPKALFDSERWDPGSKGDGNEMKWTFPVPSGTTVDVRLYFANRYSGTSQPGTRVFDVCVEDQPCLDNFDIVAATGGTDIATMRDWSVVSDGEINIDLTHEVENPLIDGIEIVQTDPTPAAPTDGNTFNARSLNAAGAVGQTQTVDTSMATSQVRGAFMLNGMMYYGLADGTFNARSFDGQTLGAQDSIDPYNDPFWSDKSNGSGGTYRGTLPDLYGSKMAAVSSMFYSSGRIYYTLNGQSQMRSRAFTPDSGIMGAVESTISDGLDWSGVAGAFLTGDTLYYASKADGVLHKIGWGGDQATGSSTVVDSSRDWATRGMFLTTPVNTPPNAQATVSCGADSLTCSFDGSASVDPDGSIVRYDWDFGDGQTATDAGPKVSHAYATSGQQSVTLTVTDNQGASATTSVTASPAAAPEAMTFRGQSTFTAKKVNAMSLSVPNGVVPGDTMLLFSSFSVVSASSSTPDGWSLLKTQKQSKGMVTRIYSKVATADDTPGTTVPLSLNKSGRAAGVLAAYSAGASAPVSATVTGTDSGTSTHVTPSAAVVEQGSWAVSYWADRSNPAATGWSSPAGVTVRATTLGQGTQSLSSLLADSNGPVTGATYGGISATATGNSLKGVTATVILRPDQP
ncbi:MAG: PKD domain-containing protein [Humibacillus sp.]|nr:PKD domain-containing protein [Humibacillus sp.]